MPMMMLLLLLLVMVMPCGRAAVWRRLLLAAGKTSKHNIIELINGFN